MSAALGIIGVAAQVALDYAIFRTYRKIETIVPDCTIEERHSDRLVITEHPVEQGAAISDHAYKLPSEVTIRYGFSNSSAFLSPESASFLNVSQALGPVFGQGTPLSQAFGEVLGGSNYVQTIYQSLLDLQIRRIPFSIITGKRVYNNMLVASLDVTTDASSEYTLMVTVGCREVIIVQTSAVQIPAMKDAQRPQVTPVTDQGTKTPESVSNPNSVLRNITPPSVSQLFGA
jgi:hypothetical protein